MQKAAFYDFYKCQNRNYSPDNSAITSCFSFKKYKVMADIRTDVVLKTKVFAPESYLRHLAERHNLSFLMCITEVVLTLKSYKQSFFSTLKKRKIKKFYLQFCLKCFHSEQPKKNEFIFFLIPEFTSFSHRQIKFPLHFMQVDTNVI